MVNSLNCSQKYSVWIRVNTLKYGILITELILSLQIDNINDAHFRTQISLLRPICKCFTGIFTESTLWVDSVSKLQCPSVVCLCAPFRKTRFWRWLLIEGCIANIGISTSRHYRVFVVSMIFRFCIFFVFVGSLQSILLCIMGELAGEGLRLWLLVLVTGDRWHMTRDTWPMTRDTWHLFLF